MHLFFWTNLKLLEVSVHSAMTLNYHQLIMHLALWKFCLNLFGHKQKLCYGSLRWLYRSYDQFCIHYRIILAMCLKWKDSRSGKLSDFVHRWHRFLFSSDRLRSSCSCNHIWSPMGEMGEFWLLLLFYSPFIIIFT